MKRYVSVIKGIKYWYVVDRVYIAKGRTKSTSACLGRVDTASAEMLDLKEAQFRQRLTDIEAQQRTQYWSKRVESGNVYAPLVVQHMERLRANLDRARSDVGPFAAAALQMAFLVDFIYNSNRIEGSKLRRDQVRSMIQSPRARNNEVANAVAAKEYTERTFNFTIKRLERAHATLLAHEPSKHGYRTADIIVGSDATLCPPDEIRPRLEELFHWYASHCHGLYPPELAFTFYYRFERIHPFIDGNGRLGRLLLNRILRDARYHPIIVWNKNQLAHFHAFAKAAGGRMAPFLRFMNGQYEKTYKTYLAKIEPARDYAKRVEYFLSPSE